MTGQGDETARGLTVNASRALAEASQAIADGRLFDAGLHVQRALGFVALMRDGEELDHFMAQHALTTNAGTVCQQLQQAANKLRAAVRPDRERCQHPVSHVRSVLHVDWCDWCGAMRTSRPASMEPREWVRPQRDVPMDAPAHAVVAARSGNQVKP